MVHLHELRNSRQFAPANTLSVAPFTTPPGGGRFNWMNIFIHFVPANTKLSFGIYDELGQRVASSGRIEPTVGFL